MLTFRSLTDVAQVQLPPNQRRAVTRAVRSLLDAYGDDYAPDDCCFVVLVTEKTTDADALELMGRPWAETRLEAATLDKETGCFLSCWLANKQYALPPIVPNENLLDPAFRALLVHESGGADVH